MSCSTISTFTDGDHPVEIQTNSNGTKYRIVYGVQVKDFSDWSKAAREYGNCVFHSLECAAKIDRGN